MARGRGRGRGALLVGRCALQAHARPRGSVRDRPGIRPALQRLALGEEGFGLGTLNRTRRSPMRRLHAMTLSLLLFAGAAGGIARPARADDDLAQRVTRSRQVYQELVTSPDRGVPQELRENCKAVAVLPHVIKGAIGVGARFGKGVISCRDAQGQWSPVAFVHLTGGSWGLQLGAEAADVVLFFMTDASVHS